MAEKQFKNVLLKGGQNGEYLLPITLSKYVEYKDGVSVYDKLANISDAIADNGEVQQNIINTVNDILTASYATKPVYAYTVVANNNYTYVSDEISSLQNAYVQDVIEILDKRSYDNLSYINDIKSNIGTIENNITTLSGSISNLSDAISDLSAEDISFDPSGTAYMTSATNVDDALKALDTQLQSVEQMAQSAIEGGVTNVVVNGPLTVGGATNSTGGPGSVTVGLNVDDTLHVYGDNLSKTLGVSYGNTLKVENGQLEVNVENLTISKDNIEGGLDASSIEITYTYVEGGENVEGSTTLQEFYNNTTSYLDSLDDNYKVGFSGGQDSDYLKYTITQGNETYEINIPKDQFLDSVEFVTDGEWQENGESKTGKALKFTWKLNGTGADDEIDGDKYNPVSYIGINDFLSELETSINSDITNLNSYVTSINSTIDSIESDLTSYDSRISALEDVPTVSVSLDGESPISPDATTGVIELTSKVLYISGNSTEGLSNDFLSYNGITLS